MDNTDNQGKWSVYEANVQSYRSNMIASQSFLLAMVSFLVSQTQNYIYLFSTLIFIIIALLQLWLIWFEIIKCRIFIVDYYKFNLKHKYDNDGNYVENAENYLQEETYVKKKNIRIKVNKDNAIRSNLPKLKYNFRETRVKLDIILPISFSIIWIVLASISITNNILPTV